MYRYVDNVSTLQRRGPIAAEFSGPGPAAIALPTLFGSAYIVDNIYTISTLDSQNITDANIRESNKPKSPAFSFGLKNKPETSPVSPSPNTYNTSGITAKGRLRSFIAAL